MQKNVLNTKLIFVYLTFAQICLLLSPSVSAGPRYATDELSVSHQHACRLIARQMAMNPVHRFSDNVKPISFREITYLYTASNDQNGIYSSKQNNSFHSLDGRDEIYSKKKLFKPIKELNFHNTSSSKESPYVPSNYGERFKGKQLTAFSAYGHFYLNQHLIASHETRVDSDQTSNQLRLYRFRLKTGFKRYSLSYARESLVLGPGYFEVEGSCFVHGSLVCERFD